jgi:phenylphosphate carboxylase alpha subunit
MAYKYYKDNRSYLEALLETGDAITVNEEVDWDLEMGAIVRRTCEKKGPAVFFKNIKDYPGFECIGAPIATYRRLAIAFGMDPDTRIPEISAEYLRRTTGKSYPPKVVTNAPCQEVVLQGDDANILNLPAPMVHDGDGGRYIGTWQFVVAKDLDTPFVNWGMYRQMAFDEKTMVGPVLPFSDMGKMWHNKYQPANIPMPFAVVINPDPLSAIASCAPAQIPEDEFTSQLMGEPVEVVKCVTCDLYVPAHAEIIIEGVIVPNVTIEYTGYRTSPREPRTVYHVKAITMRKKPIMAMSNMGTPTDEGQLLRSFSLGLEMDKMLRDQGIPITGVYMLPESTHHLTVVGVKPAYANIATQIGQLVFGSKLGPWFHMLVVVDEKTDIYDKDELIHALSTKCHPVNGIRIEKFGVGTPLNPFATPAERRLGVAGKVIFDCTFPLDWSTSDIPIKVSFDNVYPKDIQEKVIAKWKTYGFKE